MSSVKFMIPKDAEANAGEEVEVPEVDAAHFDKKGWERVGSSQKKQPTKHVNTKN